MDDEAARIFRERFELQRSVLFEHEEEEAEVEENEVERTGSGRVFWAFMAFLFLCPFALTGLLFYSLSRYETLAGPDFLSLVSSLSEGEQENLSQQTGLTDLDFVTDLYDSRFLIAAGVFTIFFTLILIAIGLRALYHQLTRNR